MNREEIDWGDSDAHEIVALSTQLLKFKALCLANPQEPRYPSSRVDGGSRSTDSTSPTERAALQHDPIEDMKRSTRTCIKLGLEQIRLACSLLRTLETPGTRTDRQTTVSGCEGCGGPAVNGVSHRQHGPFCSRCYQSWYRFKAANDKGTFKQWQDKRNEAAA